jgi:hypothetical protein
LNKNLEAVLKFEMARCRTDTKRILSLLLSQLEMLPAGSWQEVPQTYEWFEWFERFVFAHIRTFSFAHSNVKATLPKACTNPFEHKLLRRTRHASIGWWPPIHKIPLRNLQGFMPTNPKKNREKRRKGKKKRLVSDRNSGIQSDPSGMLGIHIQHQIQYSSIWLSVVATCSGLMLYQMDSSRAQESWKATVWKANIVQIHSKRLQASQPRQIKEKHVNGLKSTHPQYVGFGSNGASNGAS